MTFRKLTDKETAQVQKHREKHGPRSANVYRANLMRGKSHEECEKLAVEKTPNLPPRRERRKKIQRSALVPSDGSASSASSMTSSLPPADKPDGEGLEQRDKQS